VRTDIQLTLSVI